MCCYGFSQDWKSLYNTVVYIMKSFIQRNGDYSSAACGFLYWININYKNDTSKPTYVDKRKNVAVYSVHLGLL